MYDNVFIECRELEIVSWHGVNSRETKHNSHVLMSSKIKNKKPSFWRFSKSSFYYKKMSLENVFTIVAKPLHYMLTNWICKFVRLFQTCLGKLCGRTIHHFPNHCILNKIAARMIEYINARNGCIAAAGLLYSKKKTSNNITTD